MNCIHSSLKTDYDKLIKYFLMKGNGYFLETTGKSMKIIDKKDKESYILSAESVGFGLMKIIKKVKDNVKKNIIGKELIEMRPQYFEVNNKHFTHLNKVINNVCEIDLTKAYLYSALKLGFISKDVFDLLDSISGTSRKIALGSLATKKRIQEFDAVGIMVDSYSKNDEELSIVWKMICCNVDSIMQEIIIQNEFNRFIFYWVDNIFFLNDKKKYPYPVIVPNGIEFKTFEHSYLTYEKKRNNVAVVELSDSREFSLRI